MALVAFAVTAGAWAVTGSWIAPAATEVAVAAVVVLVGRASLSAPRDSHLGRRPRHATDAGTLGRRSADGMPSVLGRPGRARLPDPQSTHRLGCPHTKKSGTSTTHITPGFLRVLHQKRLEGRAPPTARTVRQARGGQRSLRRTARRLLKRNLTSPGATSVGHPAASPPSNPARLDVTTPCPQRRPSHRTPRRRPCSPPSAVSPETSRPAAVAPATARTTSEWTAARRRTQRSSQRRQRRQGAQALARSRHTAVGPDVTHHDLSTSSDRDAPDADLLDEPLR